MSKEIKMADRIPGAPSLSAPASRAAMEAATESRLVFEAYKETNEARLAEIEKKGAPDPLIADKLARIDRSLDALNLKAMRGDVADIHAHQQPSDTGQTKAWQRYLRAGDEQALAHLETKALNASVDSEGGYLAPPELDQMIEARLMAASPMRQIASVQQSSASIFRKPIGLGVEARWSEEQVARPQTQADGFEMVTFPAGELFAQPAATQTLLEDSYADIETWLAGEVETAFASQESAAFIHGDGVNKPRGLLDYETVDEASHVWGKLGRITGDFTGPSPADDLINLIYTPKSHFRANGRFIMNRRTVSEVRKLKDSDGRYIWQPGPAGQAASLFGYAITEVEDMPDIATGQSAIGFGDFRRAYLIIDRVGTRVLRDPYSAKPFILFYTTKRVGGGIQNFDAVKLMQF